MWYVRGIGALLLFSQLMSCLNILTPVQDDDDEDEDVPINCASYSLDYPKYYYYFITNHSNVSATPTVTGSSATFSIAPPLPTGISMNPANGVISGTATAPEGVASYTVTMSIPGCAGKTDGIRIGVDDGYVVDSQADDASDGVLDDVCMSNGGNCTLRAAVEEANLIGAIRTIYIPQNFKIDLSGSHIHVNADMNIIGENQANVIVDAQGASRGFYLGDNFNVNMSYLTVQNGLIAGEGGAIFVMGGNTTLEYMTVKDSSATGANCGGGIRVHNGFGAYLSNLSLYRVEVTGNSAGDAGGGICGTFTGGLAIDESTISNNVSSDTGGGGLYAQSVLGAAITRSTFSANTATSGAGGGLMFFDGSNVTLTDSTLSGNMAEESGAFAHYTGTAGVNALQNVTVYNNTCSAPCLTPGVRNFPGITSTVYNSIFANNRQPNSTVDNCFVALTSAGNNLTDTAGGGADCDFTHIDDVLSTDPLLSALAVSVGSTTATHVPFPGSPVIDSGNDAFCTGYDQRWIARPEGSSCDIGAVEVEQ